MDAKWVLEYWKNKQKVKESSSTQRQAPRSTQVSVTKYTDSENFVARIKGIGSLISYVGIPAAPATDRSKRILGRAVRVTSTRKQAKLRKKLLLKAATANILTNANLLYLFSKGSPLNSQPPRPVLEPAILAPWNKKIIAKLVAEASEAYAAGRKYESKQKLKSAGAAAAKAAREWFDDPRNGWPRSAPSTILKKGGKDEPGILTGVMRNAITHIEKEV